MIPGIGDWEDKIERLSITKFRNYVLIDLMVDLNITSCQASVFRIKLL